MSLPPPNQHPLDPERASAHTPEPEQAQPSSAADDLEMTTAGEGGDQTTQRDPVWALKSIWLDLIAGPDLPDRVDITSQTAKSEQIDKMLHDGRVRLNRLQGTQDPSSLANEFNQMSHAALALKQHRQDVEQLFTKSRDTLKLSNAAVADVKKLVGAALNVIPDQVEHLRQKEHLRSDMRRLERDNGDLKKEIKRLGEQVESAKTDQQESVAARQALLKEKQELERSKTTAAGDIDRLTKETSRLSEEAQRWRQAHADAETARQNLFREKEGLQGSSNNDAMARKIEQLTKEKEQLGKEVEREKQAHIDADSARKTLLHEKESLQGDIQTSTDEVGRVQKERDEAMARAESLQREVSERKQEVENVVSQSDQEKQALRNEIEQLKAGKNPPTTPATAGLESELSSLRLEAERANEKARLAQERNEHLESEYAVPEKRKKRAKDGSENTYTIQDFFDMLSYWDEATEERKPANDLPENVKTALVPHVRGFLANPSRLTMGTHHGACAQVRLGYQKKEVDVNTKSSCHECRLNKKACILVEKGESPTFVPRPAGEKRGSLGPDDPAYWIPTAEDEAEAMEVDRANRAASGAAHQEEEAGRSTRSKKKL